jgi:acetyltransferase-like isoleucine patch superfamily enzyme
MRRLFSYLFHKLGFRQVPKKKLFSFTNDVLKGDLYDIGDFTYGTPTVLAWGEGTRLKIGKFCSIAENVTIFLGGNHKTEWVTTYPFPALYVQFPEASHIPGYPATKGGVEIGNDVWIGYSAMILSGVKIADGAVIAAGAVVTRDVGPYEIWGGNPAKLIKKRFSDTTINRLLLEKWWDWPIEEIRKRMDYLCAVPEQKN